MKKKAIYGILILMLVVGMLSGCDEDVAKQSDITWSIVESPITGRYYEVALAYHSTLAMSEVTEAEYEAYIGSLEK